MAVEQLEAQRAGGMIAAVGHGIIIGPRGAGADFGRQHIAVVMPQPQARARVDAIVEGRDRADTRINAFGGGEDSDAFAPAIGGIGLQQQPVRRRWLRRAGGVEAPVGRGAGKGGDELSLVHRFGPGAR